MFLVGGTFDRDGGKPSHIVGQMMKHLGCAGINGGHIDDLSADFSFTKILIWMPNIDNSEDKILPTIKVKYPHMLLVQSKRITDGNYTEADVVGRLLKSRALLGIAIEKMDVGYNFKLLDPLGNIYCDTYSIKTLCNHLGHRASTVSNMHRIGSKKVGEVEDFSIDEEFIEIIKNFGDKFSRFVNAVNPNRLLGNASTRCESGFPAVRDGRTAYVSRRNVDKRTLSAEDFVEVELGIGQVVYKGDNKPSVDTPIQLLLFSYFPRIKYMIHGHVYVKGAPMTDRKIPCGFIEEVADVINVINDQNLEQFSINLRGHGCIIACRDLSYFDKVMLEGRPFPEK